MFDLKTGDGKPSYIEIEPGFIRSPYGGKWYDNLEIADRGQSNWNCEFCPEIGGKKIKLSGRYANEKSCIEFWKKVLKDRPEPWCVYLIQGNYTVTRLKPL